MLPLKIPHCHCQSRCHLIFSPDNNNTLSTCFTGEFLYQFGNNESPIDIFFLLSSSSIVCLFPPSQAGFRSDAKCFLLSNMGTIVLVFPSEKFVQLAFLEEVTAFRVNKCRKLYYNCKQLVLLFHPPFA